MSEEILDIYFPCTKKKYKGVFKNGLVYSNDNKSIFRPPFCWKKESESEDDYKPTRLLYNTLYQ
jgi:hypothetical protein